MIFTCKPLFNLLSTLTLLLALFISHSSFAACSRGGGLFDDKSISTSTINLPKNLLVTSAGHQPGEVFYDSGMNSGSNSKLTISGCGRNYVVGFFFQNSPQSGGSPGSYIMPTNIPGIGVKVFTLKQAGPYDSSFGVDNNWHPGDGGSSHTLNGSAYQVQIVATGDPISSGTLSFGSPLAQVEFRESASHTANGDVASNVVLSNANVIIKATGCTADVSGINFAFGNLDASIFETQKTVSAPATQDVNLSCEPGTNVSLTVTAAAASEDTTGTLITLENAGGAGIADGIGVQLGLKSRLYDSGSDGLPLNTSIPLITSTRGSGAVTSGGTESLEKLTFSALYYKIKSTVTPGKANATATMTLTYN